MPIFNKRNHTETTFCVYCKYFDAKLLSFFRQVVQENSVWSALNFFYVAVMFHIYHIWKVEHKSIKDSGYVLKGNFERRICIEIC